jgi:hypothetical protein
VIDLADLLIDLVDAVPISGGGPEVGIDLEVESMEVELPIETCLGDGGRLLASFPRGRMATRFDPALARVAARFAVRGG